MAKRLTASELPELHLTNGDHQALEQLRDDLRIEVVSQYEHFLWSRKRNIDSRRWKFVRSDKDLHAYTERESGSTLTPSAAAALLASEPQAHLAQQLGRGRLMVVGTVPGTLDDVMYAQTYHDTPSLRTMWAYGGDHMNEAAVLSVMEQASEQDPYLFSGISWCMRKLLLVKDRHALVFDDIRLSTLSNGERIGVNVSHSVNHQDLPDLKDMGTVRVTISVVTIFRQFDANNVDVYMTQIMDNSSPAPESFFIQRVAKAMMAVQTSSDVALSKKLHHLLQKRSRRRQNSQQSTRSMEEPVELEEKRTRCQHCDRRLCSFGNPSRLCQLCDEEICQKCVVTRELIIDATASETTAKPFGFCVACILRTGAARAIDIARADVRARESAANARHRDKMASIGSDSTASSIVL